MANKTMPKDHPVAWGSPLWAHLELIRSMRRQRKKWAAIAAHLETDHGVKVTFRTVRNFFRRATDPNRKRPLGFDPEPLARTAGAHPVQLNTTDLTLADTSEAGRHNFMLMIQHMLERNPDQTLSEAMTKAIVWLQENEKENFETPRLRANRTSWK